MNLDEKTMRDVFIEELYKRMHEDKNIFFVCADFGSPKLDKLRQDFGKRFVNVGIAEQNLINVSTGLALEGFTVYAYAIAPFLTMRPYEQIRVNLSLLSQIKEINVNLVGVGAGLSYDVSGPTHHCLEDIIIMRALPNLVVFSPSDWVLAREFVDYSIKLKKPKYIRLDGKPLPCIYHDTDDINPDRGFSELRRGKKVCLVSTGYMTQKALRVAELLSRAGAEIGIIDVYMIKPLREDILFSALKKYEALVTLEEGFINKGGLDSLIASILGNENSSIRLNRLGFGDAYVFNIGGREYLYGLNKLDDKSIADYLGQVLSKN